jgi:hypothetical protein
MKIKKWLGFILLSAFPLSLEAKPEVLQLEGLVVAENRFIYAT